MITKYWVQNNLNTFWKKTKCTPAHSKCLSIFWSKPQFAAQVSFDHFLIIFFGTIKKYWAIIDQGHCGHMTQYFLKVSTIYWAGKITFKLAQYILVSFRKCSDCPRLSTLWSLSRDIFFEPLRKNWDTWVQDILNFANLVLCSHMAQYILIKTTICSSGTCWSLSDHFLWDNQKVLSNYWLGTLQSHDLVLFECFCNILSWEMLVTLFRTF